MLEMTDDRRGGSLTTIHGAELAAWERFCLSLRLEDTWLHPCFARSQGSLAFSRLDRRVGSMIMSRIDWIYVSDMFGDCGGTVGILAGSHLSDHSLVMLVSSEGTRPTIGAMRIPASVQCVDGQ